jgi:hypothetical protein
MGRKVACVKNIEHQQCAIKVHLQFKTALMGYSVAWGERIHENNKSKILWYCPFKRLFCYFVNLVMYSLCQL